MSHADFCLDAAIAITTMRAILCPTAALATRSASSALTAGVRVAHHAAACLSRRRMTPYCIFQHSDHRLTRCVFRCASCDAGRQLSLPLLHIRPLHGVPDQGERTPQQDCSVNATHHLLRTCLSSPSHHTQASPPRRSFHPCARLLLP